MNTTKYSPVLDESSHMPFDDDTVEIVLNDGDSNEDPSVKLLSKSKGTYSIPVISSIYLFWELVSFSWIKPLLELGNKRPLQPTDLLALVQHDSANGIYSRFRSEWKKALSNNSSPSLVWTYVSSFGGPFIAAGGLKLIHDSSLFVGPILLRRLIDYLNDPTTPRSVGYRYVTLLFLSNAMMSLCLRQYFFWCYRVGMRLRSAVITSVFHKSLRLSCAALDRRSSGQITNLMSIDSTRLQELTPYLHAVWYSFLQIGFALYFLWELVGVSCVGGVVVIVVCIPLTGQISARLKTCQKELSAVRDERVKLTNEVLSGMKVIKIQAWEREFQERMAGIREREMAVYKRYTYMQTLSGTFSSSIPLLVAMSTFCAFVALGGELDVATALTALALFELLRFPLFMLPSVLNNLVEAHVAVERIRSFLLEPEKVPTLPLHLTRPGVELNRTTAIWDSGKRLSKEEAVIISYLERKPRLYSRLRAWVAARCSCWKPAIPPAEASSTVAAIGAALTEEEFELVLCRAQLSDALGWISVLEDRLRVAGREGEYPSSYSADTSLLQESEEEASPYHRRNGFSSKEQQNAVVSTGNQNGSFHLDLDPSERSSRNADRLLTLSRLTFCARPGDIVALVGQVGCGKSSVFSTVLGDMRVVDGVVAVRGSVAYVGQRPFVQNCSVRDNILFGQPYDDKRYKWVLDVCALLPDMKVLPAGDQTEIGERGINLSGGQKARVALARAVYSDADVFLLDDPLSAVDAHVGMQLFEKCILGLQERGKCVIISTNALHFLRSVTRILVLKEGRVVECGRFESLVRANGVFGEMMATFDEAKTSAASTREEDSDVSVVPTDGSSLIELGMVSAKESQKPLQLQRGKSVSFDDGDQDSASRSTSSGTLIIAEELECGSVDRKVYLAWARAAGGLASIAMVILLYIVGEGLLLLSSWWLSYWSRFRDQSSPWYFLGVYAAMNAAVCVSLFLRELACRLCCWHAGRVLYVDILRAVLYSPLSFFDTTPLGRIVNRLSKDIYTVDEQLPQTVRWYISSLLKVIASVMYTCIVTPMFILGLIPISAFYYRAQSFYVRTSRELSRLESASRSPIYALFSETLNGMSTVRAFKTEDMFVERIYSLLDQNQRAYFLTFSANCWLAVRLELAGAMIVTFTALFAVLGRDESPPSPEADARRKAFSGVAGLALSFALSITQSLNWSVRMAADLESQMVAVERIQSYSSLPQEAPHEKTSDPPASWPGSGALEFDDVCLRYRPGLPRVLNGVSFTVQPREKIGIVGRTGAGKSSLVVALLRLVELDSGAIRIDGADISNLGLRRLRSAVAVIPQDPILFSGSLRSNVDPFSRFSDSEVWDTLRRVQLGESFSSLEAPLGEGASNLSVGQRQLICIARALLSRCKVIVMDEATASVDVETDALIQKAIREEFVASTCLTVAHRLNTIMDSDRVLVMDKGRVAEFASPRELLANTYSSFSSLVANWERAGFVE